MEVRAVLDLLKQILGIEGSAKDDILNHYLEQASNAARVYCNVDELPESFNGAVVDLAAYLYEGRSGGHIKTQTQGERTTGYFEPVDIPEHIKVALPLPRVRVVSHVL
jgi:hypothetical protein